jgi:tetratricopeptide (TPR) repeat protein
VEQRKAPFVNATFAYRLGINTNLGQVSDWLTKIIVGLGLVQIKQAPEYLQRLAWYTGQALGAQTKSVDGEHKAAALVIYFTVLGLLGGYLLTRMFFAAAFGRADRTIPSADELDKISKAPSHSTDDPENLPKLEGRAAIAAEKIKDLSPEDAKMFGISTAVLARAKLVEKKFKEAIELYSKAIGMSPDDPKLRFDYATALRAEHRPTVEIIVAFNEARRLRDKAPLDLIRSIYESLTLLELYVPPPDGFQKAIGHGEEYMTEHPHDLESAHIWGRLACAYGQKAGWILRQGGNQSDSDFQNTRHEALRAVKEAIRLNDVWRETLRAQLQPTPDQIRAGEDDLKSFEDDKEFRQALGLPPKP